MAARLYKIIKVQTGEVQPFGGGTPIADMTLEQITKALSPLVAEWTVGAIVYDRITAKRGMIMGYQVVHPLFAQLRVDWGDGGLTSELPISLCTTKPSDGTDGDEWKDGTEEARS